LEDENSVIEIVRNKEELKRLEPEWNRLARPLATPLALHDWFFCCVESFYKEEQIHIVVVRQGERIAAIAPLVKVEQNGVDTLELIGISFLYEPCYLLYENVDALYTLLNAILKLRMPLFLRRIPASFGTAKAVRELIGKHGVVIERAPSESGWVDIDKTWDECYRSLSNHRKKQFRRSRKKTLEKGRVRFVSSSPDDEVLDEQFEEFVRIEASGWKGRQGSALRKNDRLRRFFYLYAKSAQRNQILRICFLSVDTQNVAAIMGLECANRFWDLKVGYDEAWAKFSPGTQLSMETIKYAHEKGLDGYEFLGTFEPWQEAWTEKVRRYDTLVVYPFSASGLYLLIADIMRYAVRRLVWPFRKTAIVT
jgi:CelD/BcsL family acetyltransferase involved in cellulose biosynthesis